LFTLHSSLFSPPVGDGAHDAPQTFPLQPDKRELADPVTNRAVVQSNEYHQTASPEIASGRLPARQTGIGKY
ncbi:MAG: hypothetical protein IJB91_07215, partial [Oscillospiraceae bacterium]|nr:hypothetical protein [Oscillospiraceae bacterium]